eukprot:scaffold1901_cov236-Pinguiococcus_pyrenoidosus.AAC.1
MVRGALVLLVAAMTSTSNPGSSATAFSMQPRPGPAARRLQSDREKPLKGVIFDVDGTLADSTSLGFSATNMVLEHFGFPTIEEEEYHRGTKYTTPVRLAWHAHKLEAPEEDLQAAAAKGAEMGRFFDETYVEMVTTETAGMFPGIREMLLGLAATNVPMALLSNAALAYVERVAQVNEIKDLFPVRHGADSVPAAKPAPDGLQQCCRELGEELAPDEYIYVGDGPNDGIAARAAGMASVGVTWGSCSRDDLEGLFDTVVDSALQKRSEFAVQGAGHFSRGCCCCCFAPLPAAIPQKPKLEDVRFESEWEARVDDRRACTGSLPRLS